MVPRDVDVVHCPARVEDAEQSPLSIGVCAVAR